MNTSGSLRSHHMKVWLQEELVSLRKLPTEAQIEEVRRHRYERAQKQIELERERIERERERREREWGEEGETSGGRVQQHDDDNPILEQMNIIRDYIKEARRELRFEEVRLDPYWSLFLYACLLNVIYEFIVLLNKFIRFILY